ncbi:hypothetical protein E0632_26260 [Salmonella enterica subsp. enterica]|nr:hypothetical protein [Salmonella enterica subsp. enterica]
MEEIGEAVAKKLPPYMVPDRLIAIADVPLNANGKVDYVSLRKRLEEAS